MATIQKQRLNDRVKGDTFKSVQFTFKDTGGDAIDLTGATLQIQFRYKSKKGNVAKDVSSGSGITVSAPATGVAVLDAFTPITWDAGTYYYDVQITFADTTIQTPVYGTVEVLQDTTYS